MTTSPLQRVSGHLRLDFTYDSQRQCTNLVRCEQEPPLRIVHAFPISDSGTLLHLHNVSGGVLGGDQLAIEVDVGSGARVQLTTTGATRIYRSRPAMPVAQQACQVSVQAGGLLEFLPDQLIPFAGSRYRQTTRIQLADDAGLFWWETIAPGRLACGESFAYDLLQLEMDVSAGAQPIFCERLKLEPARCSLSSPVRLENYFYFTSFVICRVGVPAKQWLDLEQELTVLALQCTQAGEISWGVSTLVAHGLIVRAVSRRGYAIAPGLLAFWRAAKRVLYGAEAIVPRKIY